MRNSLLLVLASLIVCFPLISRAESIATSDELSAAIEYLIKYVDTSGLTFIRNGKRNDAPAASAHIRSKYEYFKNSIKTPEEFIEKTAAKSLMTGSDYLVVRADGSEKKVKDWLTEELARYRASHHGKGK